MNYFINAKKQTTIQGIAVNISAEFERGKLPGAINISATGQIVQNDKPAGYLNLSAGYNVSTGKFETCNCVNVSVSFLQEVVTEAVDMYNQIDKDTNAADS